MLKSTTIYLNIDRIVLYVTSEKTPVMEKWFWPRKEKVWKSRIQVHCYYCVDVSP